MSPKKAGSAMNGTIKTEPVASTRLQGFKVPRDLSLGACATKAAKDKAAQAANKKVFTPNLNISRNRTTSSSSTDSTSSNGSSRGGKQDRGRGRGRGASTATRGRGKTLIQSVGLFSEGTSQVLRRTAAVSRPTYNEGSGGGGVRRPIITKNSQKFDEGEEEQNLKDYCPDDGTDDGFTSLATEDDFNVPVVLRETKILTDAQELTKYPESLKDFFQRSTQQLFLIQLPDTLPGQGNEQVEPKKTEKVSLNAANGNANEEEQDSNFCLMKGLSDGLIGKFIRYKSGKTKLVLGNTRFDADLGLEPGFLQEVVSVRTNTTERNGDIINLGKINAKVNVSPDWEEMFQSMDTSS